MGIQISLSNILLVLLSYELLKFILKRLNRAIIYRRAQVAVTPQVSLTVEVARGSDLDPAVLAEQVRQAALGSTLTDRSEDTPAK